MSVIGLGYVGMPLAIAFGKKVEVIGFDLNEKRIELYRSGIDPTNEVGDEVIKESKVEFTFNEEKIKEAKFHLIAVPTPINDDKTPDLKAVKSASEMVGRNLTKGSIVVYESTVYPGVTEDVCLPILERESNLKCGLDFKVGYSPERINPGDKVHTLENITKIVSGMDEDSLEEIAKVYELIIEAGVHKTGSIKVAEAAKVVENSQRDINIAFMNELAMVFDRMNIDTKAVVDAMNTKWNSLGFSPGLVGGHCISVDPYYFVYEAEKLGYHSQIILSGRKINDGMGQVVGDAIIKKLILANKVVKQAKVVILGIAFKENCPDIRNSKVVDIIKRLNEYGIEPTVVDEHADKEEVHEEYGIELVDFKEIDDADCIALTVAHDEYSNLSLKEIDNLFESDVKEENVIIDVRNALNKKNLKDKGYVYWSL